MAVIQRFEVELEAGTLDESLGCLAMSREQAEQLFADLAEALGTAPVGLADDVRALIGMVHSLYQLIEDVSSPRFTAADPYGINPEPPGTQMTPDEALAAMQVSAQAPAPSYERNPGSGIGNGPA